MCLRESGCELRARWSLSRGLRHQIGRVPQTAAQHDQCPQKTGPQRKTALHAKSLIQMVHGMVDDFKAGIVGRTQRKISERPGFRLRKTNGTPERAAETR